jgi:hypothetical protein
MGRGTSGHGTRDMFLNLLKDSRLASHSLVSYYNAVHIFIKFICLSLQRISIAQK